MRITVSLRNVAGGKAQKSCRYDSIVDFFVSKEVMIYAMQIRFSQHSKLYVVPSIQKASFQIPIHIALAVRNTVIEINIVNLTH